MASVSDKSERSEDKMFCRIIDKGAIVKSQQKDEEDLTKKEKIEFLRASFEKNKESFLFKFGKCLSISDLHNFEDAADSSDCKYYARKLKEELNPNTVEVKIKNRRFNYLKRTLEKSSYFSDDEMKYRCPLLYRQYIEQYKTYEERLKEKENDLSQNTLSQFLFGTIDKKIYEARCRLEEEQQEEFDSDDESKEEMSEEEVDEDSDFKRYADEDKTKIPEEEKERLRSEFISLMEERFLCGDDNEFNYEQVDNNEQYDDIYDQDLEESFFDKDD